MTNAMSFFIAFPPLNPEGTSITNRTCGEPLVVECPFKVGALSSYYTMSWRVSLAGSFTSIQPDSVDMNATDNYHYNLHQSSLTIMTFNPLVNDMIDFLRCTLTVNPPNGYGFNVQISSERTGNREIGILQG